ncbi:MAG: thioredoxin domain-containing protein [Gammaproteobacteria bacterium]|nr:thioredoxin domain-containing protein [Gammaproteobacteria bacterium]
MHRNRLHAETSPYLLQHAHQAVEWYPWCDEAFERAAAENRPLLLSIGYSACHWCHVMAEESFEDPRIAALMNDRFVNVKVDREERPDVDRIYQIAQQLITRAPGGWPLTMFLDPVGRHAFFGGTYFPREARHGLPAFADLLERVAQYFAEHRAEIAAQAAPLREAFAEVLGGTAAPDGAADPAPIEAARAALAARFDGEFGGFGQGMKFPQTAHLERALRHWRASATSDSPDLDALYIATLSLTRMAEGGLQDQVGGGFHRYCIDRGWQIPHFEKMLYDNALLLPLYAEAHLATGDPAFARTATATAEWALREMRSAEGAFHASLDADSGGGEGRYYLWDRDQVAQLLSPREYAAFAARFGLDGPANFEDAWHLSAVASIEAIADRSGEDAQQVERSIEAARRKLLTERGTRPRPATDTKALTAWNALMVKGLAYAARVLQREDFAQAATDAADFIANRLWRDGRLLASYAGGQARLPAYLDDHAFLLDALLELLQLRWRPGDWRSAVALADLLIERFEDPGLGGFFFTASDQASPIYRVKAFADESLPSGIAVAVTGLLRIGHLSGERRYLEAARRALSAARPLMLAQPDAHMSLVNALHRELDPPVVVIVRGPDEDLARWMRELGRVYSPAQMVLGIPDGALDLPGCFADKRAGPVTRAYLCRGPVCSAPVEDLVEMMRLLRDQNAPAGPGNSTGLSKPSADTEATPKK